MTSMTRISGWFLGAFVFIMTGTAFAAGEDLRSLYAYSKNIAATTPAVPVSENTETKYSFEFRMADRAYSAVFSELQRKEARGVPGTYTQARFEYRVQQQFDGCHFLPLANGKYNGLGKCLIRMEVTTMSGRFICEVQMKNERDIFGDSIKAYDSAECYPSARQ